MTNAERIKALREVANWIVAMSYNSEYAHDELKMLHYEDSIRAAADALEAADKRIARLEEDLKTREAEREVMQDTIKICEEAADRYKAQMPKEGEWLRTDAFPHRVYCSCCYKTYVPNENWQIWQDDADNFGLPRNYCPNCGADMRKGEHDEQID